MKKPEVTTMTVRVSDLPVTMEYVAQTASSHKVNIQTRGNGFLQKRLYQEGMIKNEQVLFTIDPRPFQVQLDEESATQASCTATHAKAKTNLDRIKPLVELSALSRKDLDNDVYFQIGLLVMVALATKNAILIVEFAVRLSENPATTPAHAAVDAGKIRLRPIIMTSLTFICGVISLALATGACANSLHSIGTAIMQARS